MELIMKAPETYMFQSESKDESQNWDSPKNIK